MFRFQCACCGEWQEGVPGFGVELPIYCDAMSASERDQRCSFDREVCTLDNEFYFVRGSIEIPVEGTDELFVWGVWVSLSQVSAAEYLENFGSPSRADRGPYFGWLSNELPVYPTTLNLKTKLHIRDLGIRPAIELEPTDHPLAVEQRNGMTIARVAEIFAQCVHQAGGLASG